MGERGLVGAAPPPRASFSRNVATLQLSCNQLCRKPNDCCFISVRAKLPQLVVLLLLALQQQAGAQLHPAGRGQGLALSRGLQQANSLAVCYGKYIGTARGKMGQRGWYRGMEATEGAGMLGID